MKNLLFCFFAVAPIWTSLGFLAGASFSYMTKKELFTAWDSLALHSRALLSKCEAGIENLEERDLAALREAIRLIENLGALPPPLPGDAAACRVEDA